MVRRNQRLVALFIGLPLLAFFQAVLAPFRALQVALFHCFFRGSMWTQFGLPGPAWAIWPSGGHLLMRQQSFEQRPLRAIGVHLPEPQALSEPSLWKTGRLGCTIGAVQSLAMVMIVIGRCAPSEL